MLCLYPKEAKAGCGATPFSQPSQPSEERRLPVPYSWTSASRTVRRNFLLFKLESLWQHRAALGNERTFLLDVLTLPPWEKHIVHRSYSRSYSQVSLEPQSMPPATSTGTSFQPANGRLAWALDTASRWQNCAPSGRPMAHWVHGSHSVRFAQLLFSWQNVSEAGWISAERMFLDSAWPLVWLRKSKKCQEDPPGCPSGHGAAWCIGITGHRNTFSFARDIYLAEWGLSFWPISLLWWNVKELGPFLNKVVITLCRLSPLSMTWSLKASVQNQASHLFLPSCPSPWWSLWNTTQGTSSRLAVTHDTMKHLWTSVLPTSMPFYFWFF